MSSSMKKNTNNFLYSEITMALTWDVVPGPIMTEFFHKLKDEKILYGMRCKKCRRAYLPPRPVCGDCFAEMKEWVPIGHNGTIMAKTICNYKILNSVTGEPRKTPFVLGLIRLDGTDTTLNHFVETENPTQVKIGDRVEIVFKEEIEGNVGDILHFKWLGEKGDSKTNG